MDWQTLLVTLYIFICKHYQTGLCLHFQRMSNNYQPDFTDEEVITIYMFGIMRQKFEVKQIYEYIQDHLLDWFPKLPSYQTYVNRLNQLCEVFPPLIERILKEAPEWNVLVGVRLMDSIPIIMANEKRSNDAKVDKEFANKSYCASKDMYFYGVKLHTICNKRYQTLPTPEYLGLTPATDHDLKAFELISDNLFNSEIYADKAYIDELLRVILKKKNNITIQTPFKKEKGQKYLDSYEKLFSTAVSKVRQPIESLYNWIQEKTHIQFASKVRSHNGLLVHVFGRLATAMFLLVFNF